MESDFRLFSDLIHIFAYSEHKHEFNEFTFDVFHITTDQKLTLKWEKLADYRKNWIIAKVKNERNEDIYDREEFNKQSKKYKQKFRIIQPSQKFQVLYSLQILRKRQEGNSDAFLDTSNIMVDETAKIGEFTVAGFKQYLHVVHRMSKEIYVKAKRRVKLSKDEEHIFAEKRSHNDLYSMLSDFGISLYESSNSILNNFTIRRELLPAEIIDGHRNEQVLNENIEVLEQLMITRWNENDILHVVKLSTTEPVYLKLAERQYAEILNKECIENLPLVAILRGIPGSGKSTISKLLCSIADPKFKVQICSADAYFSLSGTYQFNPKKLSQAHEDCKEQFVKALENRVDVVVVDNTNIRNWEYQYYVDAATKHCTKYAIRILQVCPENKPDALRLAERNRHRVPAKKVLQMHKKFEISKYPVVALQPMLDRQNIPTSAIHFVGIFLTHDSESVLLEKHPAVFNNAFAKHITISMEPILEWCECLPFGMMCSIKVVSEHTNSTHQVVAVEVEAPSLIHSFNLVPHITISVANGAKPSQSNELLSSIQKDYNTLPTCILFGTLGIAPHKESGVNDPIYTMETSPNFEYATKDACNEYIIVMPVKVELKHLQWLLKNLNSSCDGDIASTIFLYPQSTMGPLSLLDSCCMAGKISFLIAKENIQQQIIEQIQSKTQAIRISLYIFDANLRVDHPSLSQILIYNHSLKVPPNALVSGARIHQILHFEKFMQTVAAKVGGNIRRLFPVGMSAVGSCMVFNVEGSSVDCTDYKSKIVQQLKNAGVHDCIIGESLSRDLTIEFTVDYAPQDGKYKVILLDARSIEQIETPPMTITDSLCINLLLLALMQQCGLTFRNNAKNLQLISSECHGFWKASSNQNMQCMNLKEKVLFLLEKVVVIAENENICAFVQRTIAKTMPILLKRLQVESTHDDNDKVIYDLMDPIPISNSNIELYVELSEPCMQLAFQNAVEDIYHESCQTPSCMTVVQYAFHSNIASFGIETAHIDQFTALVQKHLHIQNVRAEINFYESLKVTEETIS